MRLKSFLATSLWTLHAILSGRAAFRVLSLNTLSIFDSPLLKNLRPLIYCCYDWFSGFTHPRATSLLNSLDSYYQPQSSALISKLYGPFTAAPAPLSAYQDLANRNYLQLYGLAAASSVVFATYCLLASDEKIQCHHSSAPVAPKKPY